MALSTHGAAIRSAGLVWAMLAIARHRPKFVLEQGAESWLFLSELCAAPYRISILHPLCHFPLAHLSLSVAYHVCLPCRYAACICIAEEEDTKEVRGRLYCWGYGGHGNLGLGDRRDRVAPAAVTGQVSRDCARARTPFALLDMHQLMLWLREAAVLKWRLELQLLRARGVKKGLKVRSTPLQASILAVCQLHNCRIRYLRVFRSGGLHPKEGGTEGPHTMCVAVSGCMYSFGTKFATKTSFVRLCMPPKTFFPRHLSQRFTGKSCRQNRRVRAAVG
jgi:hypothetical protein